MAADAAFAAPAGAGRRAGGRALRRLPDRLVRPAPPGRAAGRRDAARARRRRRGRQCRRAAGQGRGRPGGRRRRRRGTRPRSPRELGADDVVDRHAPRTSSAVGQGRHRRPGGADVVYDPVGGDAFDASTKCIAFEGRIVVVGFTSGQRAAGRRQPRAGEELRESLGLHWGLYRSTTRAPCARLSGRSTGSSTPGSSHPLVSERVGVADVPGCAAAPGFRPHNGPGAWSSVTDPAIELEGAGVVVTGGGSGIGAELARRFAAAGRTRRRQRPGRRPPRRPSPPTRRPRCAGRRGVRRRRGVPGRAGPRAPRRDRPVLRQRRRRPARRPVEAGGDARGPGRAPGGQRARARPRRRAAAAGLARARPRALPGHRLRGRPADHAGQRAVRRDASTRRWPSPSGCG